VTGKVRRAGAVCLLLLLVGSNSAYAAVPMVPALALKWGVAADSQLQVLASGRYNAVALSAAGTLYMADPYSGVSQTFRALGGGLPLLAVGGGQVFLTGRSGELYALEERSGWLQWQARAAGVSGVALAGEGEDALLVTLARDGIVTALAAHSGAVRWSHSCPWTDGSGWVSADDERVYLASAAGHVAALSLRDGELLWRDDETEISCRPVTAPGRLIVAGMSDDRAFVAVLDAASGEPVWVRRGGLGPAWTDLLVQDGCVYGRRGEVLCCFDLVRGAVRWLARPLDACGFEADGGLHGLTLGEGQLFAAAANADGGYILAFDPASGQLRWVSPVPFTITSGPFFLAGCLFYGGPSHRLLGLRQVGVRVAGRQVVFHNLPPFLADDTTFVPVREVAEALGWSVAWQEESQEVVLQRGGVKVQLPASLLAERAVLPLRTLAESLGAAVSWDGVRLLAGLAEAEG